jgi:hypothetical protein
MEHASIGVTLNCDVVPISGIEPEITSVAVTGLVNGPIALLVKSGHDHED